MPKKDIKLRSEEVQDILTKTPHWMLRWGNIILLLLIFLFFLFSWFIRYPDIQYADAIITTQIPPQKIYANTSGLIDTLFVDNDQIVKKGEILGMIENTAKLKDVLFLREIIETIKIQQDSLYFPIDKIPLLSLGEIAPALAIFEKDYIDYSINKTLDIRYNQIKSNKISDAQLHLDLKSEREIERRKIKIAEDNRLFKNLIQSFKLLQEALKTWEFKYLLMTNLDGKVSFINTFIEKNQNVNQGELLFTIVPTEKNEYVAKIKIPVENSIKIKKNQDVNIKLFNYPETEYGMLKAKIESIPTSPNKEGFYLVQASLDSPLSTSYNIEIPFNTEMQGTAEIIIEDLRLLERFFYKLKGLFNN